MKSNYKRLGDYIQEIKNKNIELKVKKLLGINIDKFFMPSVANIIGTDMSVYKIVKKNQFSCNRMHVGRDYRLPISMSTTDGEFIVSPAYDVFEIIDTKILDPDYLMMWFNRQEFDRNAWFYTDADVRGGLHWKAFCDMQLPVPHIDTQRQIVAEYNVIQNRIALNQQLIQKLEDTAQTIYKQWFVDFEFPDDNGKPYLSNGGAMVWNEELQKEIPHGWEVDNLRNLIDYKKGFAFKSENYKENGIPVFRVSDFTDKSIDISNCHYLDKVMAKGLVQYELKTNDIIITTVGSWPNNPESIVGKVIIVPELANNGLLNQNAVRLRAKELTKQLFIYYRLKSKDYLEFVISGAQGSANQASVTLEHIFSFKIIYAKNKDELFLALNKVNENILKINTENYFLLKMSKLLLSKLATI
jgi:type I restriction enzyme, S subunit